MEGWEIKTLSEVCTIVNGGTPKTSVEQYWDGPHAWVTPAEMGGLPSPYLHETRRTLTDEGLNNCSATLLPPNSVILSSRAPIGHLVINKVPMGTNQGCKGLIPTALLDYRYLYYFLSSSVKHLNELGTGATFKELAASKLKEVPIPLPPLPTQRRIVAILDEAFAAIDRAIGNVERNLGNVGELWESYRNTLFSAHHDHWTQQSLGETCTLQRGFDLPKRDRKIGNVPLISSSGVIDTHNEQRANGPGVVTGRSGSIGNVFYVEGDYWPLNTVLYVKDFHGNSPRFIYHLLQWFRLDKYASGTGVPTLNRNHVSDVIIQIPQTTEEQVQISNKLDMLLESYQRATALYDKKRGVLNSLKQSLLHQAFTGRLTSEREVEEEV